MTKETHKPAARNAAPLAALNDIELHARAVIKERLLRELSKGVRDPLDIARRATRDTVRMYRAINTLSDIMFDMDDA